MLTGWNELWEMTSDFLHVKSTTFLNGLGELNQGVSLIFQYLFVKTLSTITSCFFTLNSLWLFDAVQFTCWWCKSFYMQWNGYFYYNILIHLIDIKFSAMHNSDISRMLQNDILLHGIQFYYARKMFSWNIKI